MPIPNMCVQTTASASLSVRRTMESHSGAATAREAHGQASTVRTRPLKFALSLVILLKQETRVPSVRMVEVALNSPKRKHRTQDATVQWDFTAASASIRMLLIPSLKKFRLLHLVLANPSNPPALAVPTGTCLAPLSSSLSLLPSVQFS